MNREITVLKRRQGKENFLKRRYYRIENIHISASSLKITKNVSKYLLYIQSLVRTTTRNIKSCSSD